MIYLSIEDYEGIWNMPDYVRNVQSMMNMSKLNNIWKRCKLLAAQILNAQKNKGSQAQEYIGGNKNNQ